MLGWLLSKLCHTYFTVNVSGLTIIFVLLPALYGDSLLNLGTPQLYDAWSNVGMINMLFLTMVTIQAWLHLHLSLHTGRPVHLYTENIQRLSIEASVERCEEI